MSKKINEVIKEVASEKEAKVELVTLKEIVYNLELDYDKKSKAIRQALRSKKDELEALKNHTKKTRYEFDMKEAQEIQTFLKERFIDKKKEEKSEKKEASKKATKATKATKKKATVKKDDVKATTKKKATKKTTKKATKKVSE